jgi:Cof subfamily protein (haloacid dehalogenase superfamily)
VSLVPSRPDLVACDLDGTLLGADLVVAPDLPPALRMLREAGITIVICTGRMLQSARRVATRLGLEDGLMICYQGAMVVDLATSDRVLHQPISSPLAAEVVRHVRDLGRHLNAYIDDRLLVEELDDWARRYAQNAEVTAHRVADLEAEVRGQAPTKFVVLSDAADAAALVGLLRSHWGERLAVTRSQAEYVEITALGVSKSSALDWLCRRGDARCHRTVACGDGPNDIDMLEWATLAVAVAEAPPEVRAVADRVVPRCELPQFLRALAGH